jgi:putative hemolysin
MDLIALLAIFISLLLIGFCSGIEIAFVTSNKLSIELRKKQGLYSGRIWSNYADKPAQFIGTTIIGFNILLVVYGLLWSTFMHDFWYNAIFKIDNDYVHLIFETIISTAILLFFEFIFKAIFKAQNNSIIGSGLIAYIAKFFYSIFSGIATLFVNIAEWILLYIFNVKLNEKRDVFSKIDLESFISQSKNHDEEDIAEINK